MTQNGVNAPFAAYIYEKIKERFSFLPAEFDIGCDGDRTRVEFRIDGKYCSYVRRATEANLADVLAIGYKYRFFQKRLPLPMLSKAEKSILLAALTAADYKEDYAHVFSRVRGFQEYAIDGVFNFRLTDLKERWADVSSYVSPDFNGVYLESFLSFLIDEGQGKAYLKDGKVYDNDYRVCQKSRLFGEYSIIGELILTGAKKVLCYDEPSDEVGRFLHKYYKENAVFY